MNGSGQLPVDTIPCLNSLVGLIRDGVLVGNLPGSEVAGNAVGGTTSFDVPTWGLFSGGAGVVGVRFALRGWIPTFSRSRKLSVRWGGVGGGGGRKLNGVGTVGSLGGVVMGAGGRGNSMGSAPLNENPAGPSTWPRCTW